MTTIRQMHRHSFGWPDASRIGEEVEQRMAADAEALSGPLDKLERITKDIQADRRLTAEGKRDALLKAAREAQASIDATLGKRQAQIETARAQAEAAVEAALRPELPDASMYITREARAAAVDRLDAEVRADLRAFFAAHPIKPGQSLKTLSGAIVDAPGEVGAGTLVELLRDGDPQHAKRVFHAARSASPVLRQLMGGDDILSAMRTTLVDRVAPEQTAALQAVENQAAVLHGFKGAADLRITKISGMNPRRGDEFAQESEPSPL